MKNPTDNSDLTGDLSDPRVQIVEVTNDTVRVKIPGWPTPVTYPLSCDREIMNLEAPLNRCLRCEYNRVHGWVGPPGGNVASLAHCRGCHRNWPNRNQECHCASCCRHFQSMHAFDAHQTGDLCLDPATLLRKDGNPVLVECGTPFGPMWDRWDRHPPHHQRPGYRLPAPKNTPDDDEADPGPLLLCGAGAGSDDEDLEAA